MEMKLVQITFLDPSVKATVLHTKQQQQREAKPLKYNKNS